jgi:hypothetical protein
MDAVELAAGYRQVTRNARAGCDDDRVVGRTKLVTTDVDSRVDAEAELDALGEQLVETTLDDALLDLELRTPNRTRPPPTRRARARSPSGRGVRAAARRRALQDRTRSRPPCGRCGWSRAGDDPAFLPGAVDDRELDLLDRDRVAFADLEHAGGLARCRAEATGELGKLFVRCS